jgi:dienelactone hydrolase
MLKAFIVGLLALTTLVVGPVVVHQLNPPPARKLVGERPDPARYTDVTFSNKEQGIRLGGRLFVPSGSGPFPAAVIIQGSGGSRRDNGWYLSLAHYLQDHGIAVLLPDKRGSDSSGGDWRNASFEDLATDARAAVRFLHAEQPFSVGAVGVVGMSQGGWIAPVVAGQSKDVAFVIDVVGSAVTTHEQLIYEEDHNLRQMGMLPGISRAVALLSTFVLRHFTQQSFWNAVGDFDPLPWWRRVDQPVLVLLGKEDTNTPSIRSAELLEALGKPNIRVRIFEGSGHALQDPPGHGNRLLRQDALQAMVDFVRTLQ